MPESEAPYTFPEDESLAIRTIIAQNLETSLETLNPEDAGALTGDETVFIKVGGALKKATLQDIADLGGIVYSAILSQSSTNTPTYLEIKNNTVMTVTYSRNGVGSYSLLFSNEIVIDREKTLILMSGCRGFIRHSFLDNELIITTYNTANTQADAILSSTHLYILFFQ